MQTIEHDGIKFLCSDAQASALDKLLQTSSGFATVHGYVSTSGRTKPETANINFIARFSTEKLYQRKLEALQALTFADVAADVAKVPKLATMDSVALEDTFNVRKQKEIDSILTTQSGNRDDAYRQAHDRCYYSMGHGVKVHFKTAKDTDGIMQPVLVGGLPVVESIMLGVIEIGRKVLTEGEYKIVNSGASVLISNIIAKHLPRSTKIKTISLKEDNFTSISLGGNALVPDDIAGLFT